VLATSTTSSFLPALAIEGPQAWLWQASVAARLGYRKVQYLRKPSKLNGYLLPHDDHRPREEARQGRIRADENVVQNGAGYPRALHLEECVLFNDAAVGTVATTHFDKTDMPFLKWVGITVGIIIGPREIAPSIKPIAPSEEFPLIE